MELDEYLDRVEDRDSFLTYVKALIRDREDEVAKEAIQPSSPYGPGANGWENGRIESFLEAAVAWAEDSDFGASQGIAKVSPWRLFAEFLYCGKIYE